MKKYQAILLFTLFLLIIFVRTAAADIFLGTCEGYVFYANGTKVSGANVTVSVDDCTTSNCQGSALSDSGGYYVIANLNLQPDGDVMVSANKGNFYGSNTGKADQYQAAYVNVTLCDAPSSPVLIPIADSHLPNITFWFNWTSGSSPYSTFDNMYFDGTWYSNETSGQNKTNLDFKTYTWGVRTCLASQPSCCSPTVYDTFNVYNNIPCKPILQDQHDTNNNTVILNWTSNTSGSCPDADNDTTHYIFKIDGDQIVYATPPQIVYGLGYGAHSWAVQECDPWGCSDWATDNFNVINHACQEPALVNKSNFCSNGSSYVSLEWTSLPTDSDNESCHDEFEFNGTIINATSPHSVIISSTGNYIWKVRSCDPHGACSKWVNDSFIFCNCPYQLERGSEGGVRIISGGGGGISMVPEGYELMLVIPREIYSKDLFNITVNFKSFKSLSNLRIEAETPEGINISSVNYGSLIKNEEISLDLKTEVNIAPGNYTVYIKGLDINKKGNETKTNLIFKKAVKIKVKPVSAYVHTIIEKKKVQPFLITLVIILAILSATVVALAIQLKKAISNLRKKIK